MTPVSRAEKVHPICWKCTFWTGVSPEMSCKNCSSPKLLSLNSRLELRGPWQSNKSVVEHRVLSGLWGYLLSAFLSLVKNVLYPKSCPRASSESFYICRPWQQASTSATRGTHSQRKPKIWIYFLPNREDNQFFAAVWIKYTFNLRLVSWNFMNLRK